MYDLERTEEEIDEQLNKAIEGSYKPSRWPSMTYEQGVRAAMDWLLGDDDDPPMKN